VNKRKWLHYLFVLPYGLSFTVFIVVPILVAVALAFMRLDLTSNKPPAFIGLDNFKEAYGDDYVRKAVVVTCVFALMMVPTLIAVAFSFAMGLNAMQRGRNFVRGLLFLPGMFNVVVAGIIWRWFYEGEFGFFNYVLKQVGIPKVHWLSEKSLAMPSIVGMSLWMGLGGTTLVLLAAMQQIPRQLFEAAMLDGASGARIFTGITVPQLRPVLMFVTVTSTIGAFQVFGQPFILTQGGPELSTRALVQLIYETGFNQYRLGYAASISWILFLMIITFVILQVLLLRRSTD
jgi:multiple sugar transport system permease protein